MRVGLKVADGGGGGGCGCGGGGVGGRATVWPGNPLWKRFVSVRLAAISASWYFGA